ncbi:hypothetical protein Arad_3629 [Rhizobium rhizogenes K84]|uniref:Uncharacterized protein n=1 Tax=Rhizobium rhizogenes (strain K84 / ATCC BAA-868) TaxID=311403 RepID=B9J9D2_RHIR8|nr:hypothetical protein Arad_3629 [Rhizobium rhizogenes K84]
MHLRCGGGIHGLVGGTAHSNSPSLPRHTNDEESKFSDCLLVKWPV